MAEEMVDANAEFTAFVESCSDEEWRAVCRAEKWRVGVVAHHVAWGHERAADWVIALLALTPSFAVVALLRDAAAPPEIAKVLPAAKEQLHKTRGFQWPAGYYRYLATETRTSDNLVVLHFEYRAYPFITASRAYLASRCKPLEQIDPREMGFGWGPDSESELTYLRSRAQDPCP